MAKYNDLDMKNWKEYSDIYTDSLWIINRRDNSGAHKSKYHKCRVYYAEDERRTIPLNEFDDLSKIYGAIWTDKGLIFVAKMNNEGELELLC